MNRETLRHELAAITALSDRINPMMVAGFHGRSLQVEDKSDGTKVSDIDKLLNQIAVDDCTARGHKAVGEEGGTAPYGTRTAYYIDPIDGTNDFIEGRSRSPRRSIAMFSIGGVVNGKYTLGAVSAPLLKRPVSYQAAKGHGAFRVEGGSHRRLKVDTRPTQGAVLVSGSTRDRYGERLVNRGFLPVILGSSVFNACAVADPTLVARFDPKLIPEGVPVIGFASTRTWAHDYAATAIIGREAGAIVGDRRGGELKLTKGRNGCIFANNRQTFKNIMAAIA